MQARVLTIGHSTHPIDEFLDLLARHRVDALVDVRRHPGSRSQPQFNVEPLRASLAAADIDYAWFEALGGRRKARPDSHNTRWRNASFRGYADYMETPAFASAFADLVARADVERCALMCAEALWWRCHRSLIADALQAGGRAVAHIGSDGSLVAHPYTAAAWIDQGRLRYDAEPGQPPLEL
jgi:uncharacterized protein (DUF488 family)